MHQPLEQRQALVVRLRLIGVKPTIWRRLRLASDFDLRDLHFAIQVAMGWETEHLHKFPRWLPAGKRAAPLDLATDYEVGDMDPAEIKRRGLTTERDVRCDQVFRDVGDKLEYIYDFGDGWEHVLRLESVEPWPEGSPGVICLAGQRACPPEDSGGVYGYADLLERLAERTSGSASGGGREDDEDLEWIVDPDFDPERFDLDEVNKQLGSAFVDPAARQ
ncbi:MAG: plasmid pRiA4b ORF-3 family protein [Bifidobacteriaceae bacterium]|nr:plasmid pRiA4b ORF-3 family protein [Bifidobacteriaceae bacterium]